MSLTMNCDGLSVFAIYAVIQNAMHETERLLNKHVCIFLFKPCGLNYYARDTV